MNEALIRLVTWKYGTHPDPSYTAGSQEFANDVCAIMEILERAEAHVKELEKWRDAVLSIVDGLDDPYVPWELLAGSHPGVVRQGTRTSPLGVGSVGARGEGEMRDERASPDTQLITCRQCDGFGAGEGIDGRCPACGGIGKIAVPLEPEEER